MTCKIRIWAVRQINLPKWLICAIDFNLFTNIVVTATTITITTTTTIATTATTTTKTSSVTAGFQDHGIRLERDSGELPNLARKKAWKS